MATWTTIPDSSVSIGKPVRSIDGFALRDNPIAIAEGSLNAPRVANKAMQNTLAGVIPLNLNTTQRSTSSTVYVKIKETLIHRTGQLRAAFVVNASGRDNYSRIYVNDVAIGIERFTLAGVAATYTEDILNLQGGDAIQVYGRTTDAAGPILIASLNLYSDDAVTTVATL